MAVQCVDQNEDTVERLARILCVSKGLDPDALGYAMKDETRAEFGESYPLWQYHARDVRTILDGLTSNKTEMSSKED